MEIASPALALPAQQPVAETAEQLAKRGQIAKTAKDFEASFLSIMLGEMFKDFPTISEIYGVVRPEALDQLIAQYRVLSAQGKPGAEVMWFCLERRRMALVGDSCHQVAEVLG